MPIRIPKPFFPKIIMFPLCDVSMFLPTHLFSFIYSPVGEWFVLLISIFPFFSQTYCLFLLFSRFCLRLFLIDWHRRNFLYPRGEGSVHVYSYIYNHWSSTCVVQVPEMAEWDEEETKTKFTNYSMSSSVIRRNKELSLLDDKFEK